jgi:hypothetical protein
MKKGKLDIGVQISGMVMVLASFVVLDVDSLGL